MAEVPDEVGGKHADEHVSADPVFEMVVDRAEVQIDCFEATEVSFDNLETFVRFDDFAGVETFGGHTGADHVDPVESSLRSDLVLTAGVGESGIGDREFEVFAHFAAVDDLADPQGDLRLTVEGSLLAGGGRVNNSEVGFGRGE